MRKILLGGLILLALLGCTSVSPLVGSKVPAGSLPEDTPGGTWVYPAKVFISNLYSGARAEEKVVVHNGGNTDSTFELVYEDMPSSSGSYVVAPDVVKNWVSIEKSSLAVEPHTARSTLVALAIPEDVEVEVDKFGFLIVVSEAEQSGNVRVRHASKWLVDMR